MINTHLRDVEYHAHPFVGSTLAKKLMKSRQLFRDHQTGEEQTKDSPAFKVGRIAHMAVLEPERFAQQTLVEGPKNPKTGQEYGRETKAWAEWEAANPGAIVLPPWIAKSMKRMPQEVRELFPANGPAECSVFVDMPALGFGVKCRPDWLAGTTIIDLKTIDDVDNISRAITRYGYWFSAAWYRMVMKLETGKAHNFRLVFMEKNSPYRWRIVDLDPSYQLKGDGAVEDVLQELAIAHATGDWSDQGDVRLIESLPSFMDDSEEGDE